MFIIDGPDNVGKTTLANSVIRAANYMGVPARYVHSTRPSDCFNFGSDYLDWMTKWGVHDRFHLSNLAYQGEEIKRGQDRQVISTLAFHWLEGEIKRRGAFHVLLIPKDIDTYKQLLDKDMRDQMYDYGFNVAVAEKFMEISEFSNVWIDDKFYVEKNKYPDRSTIHRWVSQWIKRRQWVEENIYAH